MSVEVKDLTILLDFSFHDGPGTNQAYFAPEDIPKLGKLVEARSSQEPPDWGNTGVVAQFVISAPLIRRRSEKAPGAGPSPVVQ